MSGSCEMSVTVEKLTFMCQYQDCGRKYTKLNNLRRHQRKEGHKEGHGDVGKLKCPVAQCTRRFPYMISLCSHVRKEHNIPESVIRIYAFNDFEQFTLWKNQLEEDTRSRYVQHGAAKNGRSKMHYYLYCHRSGQTCKAPSRPRIRRTERRYSLKNRGLTKSEVTCTAHMSITVDSASGRVICRMCSLHVGHDLLPVATIEDQQMEPVLPPDTPAPLIQLDNCELYVIETHEVEVEETPADPQYPDESNLLVDGLLSDCRQLMAMAMSGSYSDEVLLAARKHVNSAKYALDKQLRLQSGRVKRRSQQKPPKKPSASDIAALRQVLLVNSTEEVELCRSAGEISVYSTRYSAAGVCNTVRT